MIQTMIDPVAALRTTLGHLEPAPSSSATVPPTVRQIYAPEGHEAALDPERPIVVGGRGTGKSFWSATLLDTTTRNFVAGSYPRLQLDRCDVSLGFAGVDSDHHGAPSREELDDLINTDGHPPEKVWRAVVLRSVAAHVDAQIPTRLRGTDGLVAWVSADAARTQGLLRQADETLHKENRRVIVLFDALDRLGQDWRQIRERTRALLQVTLAMRTYQSIKPKIFLRVDQADDTGIGAFPDASKLLSPGSRVDLTWEALDLYGLLYTLLANDTHAALIFSDLVREACSIALPQDHQQPLPSSLKYDTGIQAKVFSEIAGEFMGLTKQYGRTYTWLPQHLADAHGDVSPCTFLEAVRQAARRRDASQSRHALNPSGLRAGIQGAAKLRLQQLKEDYGWIEEVISTLADQQVPCAESELFARWNEAQTLGAISHSNGRFLEPIEMSETDNPQPTTILKALLRIGVAERRANGRINIPDIYRVAAKMLRKGGVTPER
jgi:hypothetical protein